MAGYVIAAVDVFDQAGFEEYRKLVSPTITAYGGKYIVRGGTLEAVEGDWTPKRLVIIEFESMELAKEWYASEEYKGPKELRHRTAKSNLLIVEGL